jgi:hypothetical protein
MDLDSLPLRDETHAAASLPGRTGRSTLPIAVLLFMIAGGVGYWASSHEIPWRSWSSRLGSLLSGGPQGATTVQQSLKAAPEARVLQFAALPDRVGPGETVRLCYEVANGSKVRIDPDVGEVQAGGRSCVETAPKETTTYMLTAEGSAGERVRQTVLVPVGLEAAPTSGSNDPGAVAVPSAPAIDPQPPAPPRTAPPDRASILIFSARPGSIATDAPTELCYATSGALTVRIEPDIGDVTPAATMTCRRVTPTRTTTYELTASGRDGQPVKQQLVIIPR